MKVLLRNPKRELDVAGPVAFAVSGSELLLLAAVARPAGDVASDPVLREAVRRTLVAHGATSAQLRSGPTPGEPAELVVRGPNEAGPHWLHGVAEAVAAHRVVRTLAINGLRVRAQ